MEPSECARTFRDIRERPAIRSGSPRILLVGYNGANNIGSEARLLAVIEDVRAVLGPSASMTVPTLNKAKQSRYLKEDMGLHTVSFSARSVIKLARLVWNHDIVLLVEGSCYMDTWASALLLEYLWVTKCAVAMHKPCLAYSVDSGKLTPANQKRVRREASKTALIITRTQAAADRLRSWGVTAPIEVTADSAFSLDTSTVEKSPLEQVWSEATSGLVGMALVDFYRWPVVFKPWGGSRNCYRWPFYFSSSETRLRASGELIKGYAAEADHIIAKHNRNVGLLCMEELDTHLAQQVYDHMIHRDRARVFSSHQYSLSQMIAVLRTLDALVSSRYHACVFAMAAGVPMVAVGHDLRIKDLFQELRLPDDFFIPYDRADLGTRLSKCVDSLLSNPQPWREAILHGHELLRERAMRNRQMLKAFVERYGWR